MFVNLRKERIDFESCSLESQVESANAGEKIKVVNFFHFKIVNVFLLVTPQAYCVHHVAYLRTTSLSLRHQACQGTAASASPTWRLGC